MRIIYIPVLIFLVFLLSCKSQTPIIYNYLEDANDTSGTTEISLKEPLIQENDLLHIQIYSASLDPRVDELYNLRTTSSGSQSESFAGILVNQQGNIEIPRVGVIQAKGLTKHQLADIIKSKLSTELKNPSVLIRFLNFRITVLGEVGTPGVLTVPTERLTLLQALGMAGDITQFGKKKEVKILRENNGKRELGTIDLTSKKMFESPYYQLQQNDVVMIEQTRYKLQELERQRVSNQISFGTAILTAVVLLITVFRN